MKDIRAYIGHDVRNVPTHTQRTIARALASVDVEGCTLIECRGLWHGVYEDTTCVFIACVSEEWAETFRTRIVPRLCEILQQEAIMIEVRESTCEFISAM